MNDANDAPLDHSNQEGGTPSYETLKQECDQLKQRLQQLEEERQRDQQALAELKLRCEIAEPYVYAWAKAYYARSENQMPDEELIRLVEKAEGETLESFIAELEQIALGK